MSPRLVEVNDLTTCFTTQEGPVWAVDGLSYTVERGEAVGIVGESGSGKSVSVRSLLRLLPKTAEVVRGEALFNGRDLLKMPEKELQRVRGRHIAMVFQNAMEALNPTVPLRRQLTEHLRWHGVANREEAITLAIKALGEVGIPEPERRIKMYPFQLSGGMRQRAMIAMAIATGPELLIADEPTTAVDVTLQRQILDLLKSLKEERGLSIIMITHDLGVAKYFCDDVVVMYAGKVMERGPMSRFLQQPLHPYSQGLRGSTVEVGAHRTSLQPIPGSPPDLAHRPRGCPFHPRCHLAELPRCQGEQRLEPVTQDREVACWKVSDR